jgi:hypothetical protein
VAAVPALVGCSAAREVLVSESEFALHGTTPGESLGHSIEGRHDLDGDGLSDLAMLAPVLDPEGVDDPPADGRVLIALGAPEGAAIGSTVIEGGTWSGPWSRSILPYFAVTPLDASGAADIILGRTVPTRDGSTRSELVVGRLLGGNLVETSTLLPELDSIMGMIAAGPGIAAAGEVGVAVVLPFARLPDYTLVPQVLLLAPSSGEPHALQEFDRLDPAVLPGTPLTVATPVGEIAVAGAVLAVVRVGAGRGSLAFLRATEPGTRFEDRMLGSLTGSSSARIVFIPTLDCRRGTEEFVAVRGESGGPGDYETALYFLHASAALDESSLDDADLVVRSPRSGSALDAVTYCGTDFNGDGDPDLVVGDPGADDDRGRVHWFPRLPNHDRDADSAPVTLLGPERGARFGAALGAWETGPGAALLAVGAPGLRVEGAVRGAAYVFDASDW